MKTYGQYCGLSRAAEVLGERWSLIILRDLLVAPRRFNELRSGIPGIPSNLLTTRLRDLESAEVVERVLDGRSVIYRVSDYGRDLEPVIVALGRWGARKMAEPREGEVPTDSSLAAALISSRTDARVRGFTVEVSAGPATAHARVSARGIEAGGGPFPEAQLRLSGTGLRRLLADGDVDGALASGRVAAEGDLELVAAFARAFRAPLDEDVAS